MTDNQIKIIKMALFDVEMLEMKKLEAFPQASVTHSAEFQQRINTLIQQERRREASFLHLTKRQKTSLLVAVIVMLTMVFTACVFRQEIKDFFINTYEGFIEFSAKEKSDNVSHRRYDITWVPEGYEMIETVADGRGGQTTWSNGSAYIYFQQSGKDALVDLDSDDGSYTVKTVGEKNVYYNFKYNTYGIVWTEDSYMFTLVCENDIPWENIEAMILSIRVIE